MPNCHPLPAHELETTRNLHLHESILFEVFSRVSEFGISNSPRESFDRDAQNAHKDGRSKRQALNVLRLALERSFSVIELLERLKSVRVSTQR